MVGSILYAAQAGAACFFRLQLQLQWAFPASQLCGGGGGCLPGNLRYNNLWSPVLPGLWFCTAAILQQEVHSCLSDSLLFNRIGLNFSTVVKQLTYNSIPFLCDWI